jgi:hypothetical protein
MHNYLTILDFANGSVDQYDLSAWDYDTSTQVAHWQDEDFENFLISEGYSLTSIEWMSHSDNTINKF